MVFDDDNSTLSDAEVAAPCAAVDNVIMTTVRLAIIVKGIDVFIFELFARP